MCILGPLDPSNVLCTFTNQGSVSSAEQSGGEQGMFRLPADLASLMDIRTKEMAFALLIY